MPAETLVTARLRLEPWSEERTELLIRLAATPAVMRFIGDGTLWAPERSAEVSAACAAHWRRHDFGWRTIVERATGEPIGLAALSYAGEGAGVDADEFEIGWWLDPVAWGRGFAREGAGAVRDEGFTRVGAPSIVARIQPANGASLGVAQAIGLRPETASCGRGGEPIAVLRLTADEWSEIDGAG